MAGRGLSRLAKALIDGRSDISNSMHVRGNAAEIESPPRLLNPIIQPLPKSLGQLAVMAVMMPLATYVAIPVITRVFKQWLHSP